MSLVKTKYSFQTPEDYGRVKMEIEPCPRCSRHDVRGWTYQQSKEFSKNHCGCEGRMNVVTYTFNFTWEDFDSVALEAESLIRIDGYGHGYYNTLWTIRPKEDNSKYKEKVKLTRGRDWPIWYNWAGSGTRAMIFYMKYFAVIENLLHIRKLEHSMSYYYRSWQNYGIRCQDGLRESYYTHFLHWTIYHQECKDKLADLVELVKGEPWYHEEVRKLHPNPDGD